MCIVQSLEIKGFPSKSISMFILSITANNGTTSLFFTSSYKGSIMSLLIDATSITSGGGKIYSWDYYWGSFEIKVTSYSSTLSVFLGKGSRPGKLSLIMLSS